VGFTIVTDTSSNLPTPLLKENDVSVIAFSYNLNGEEYICPDTEAFDGTRYYGLMRGGVVVTTSQINPQRYVDHVEPILQSGEDILFVNMSSGISGSYNCAEFAAAQLRVRYPERDIRLVDTLGASLGEGILVLKAIECRKKGLSLSDTAELLLAMRHRMYQVFIVDDLMHLKRSGRLSGTAAIVGTVLQIKPLLKGNERGEIINFGRVRGRRKAIEALAQKYDELVRGAEKQTVGIAHADCAEDAEYLAKLLRRSHAPKEIMTVGYEPVTGAHVGPGTLALFFEGDVDVRSK